MKKWLLAAAVSAALFSQSGQAQQPYQSLQNQLEIFSGILETAAKQHKEETAKLVSFEYTYLRDQGVIFRTRLGPSSWHFVRPDIPEPPMPPDAPEMGEFARDLQLDVVVEQGLRSAHRILSKLSGEYSDEWFELTEQQRDLAWEIRDIERDLRDTEFELRNADSDTTEELQQQLEQQQRQLDELRERRAEVQEQADELKQELKEQQQQARQQQRQTLDQKLVKAESLIAETLCNYGATLKALPDDEFISFVIEGAGSGDDGKRDKVYVFPKSDVNSCQTEDDAEALLETAKPYYF
ncbi:MAG: hypothetical protein ACQEQ8_02665 [Pseudomonadota bacterium]